MPTETTTATDCLSPQLLVHSSRSTLSGVLGGHWAEPPAHLAPPSPVPSSPPVPRKKCGVSQSVRFLFTIYAARDNTFFHRTNARSQRISCRNLDNAGTSTWPNSLPSPFGHGSSASCTQWRQLPARSIFHLAPGQAVPIARV
ncbi:hypothetical protein RSAG8_02401, partial [Rhizoctonia solani AG-8 WAC10335]